MNDFRCCGIIRRSRVRLLTLASVIFFLAGWTVFTSSHATSRVFVYDYNMYSYGGEHNNNNNNNNNNVDIDVMDLPSQQQQQQQQHQMDLFNNNNTQAQSQSQIRKVHTNESNNPIILNASSSPPPKPTGDADADDVDPTQSETVTQEEKQARIDQELDKAKKLEAKKLHESLLGFYNDSMWYNYATTTTASSSLHHIWDEPESKIPQWMKRYMKWHHHVVKSRLAVDPSSSLPDTNNNNNNNNNNNATGKAAAAATGPPLKFLVLHCLANDGKCGGLSDRLKPLPLLIRYACYTKRVLLIYWSRPGRLDEFMVPPKGGIDWRVPPWMVPQIEDKRDDKNDNAVSVSVYNQRQIKESAKSNIPLVRCRMQDYHGGQPIYDDLLEEGEATFARVFHDVWKIFFTPSPPVRTLLESEMQRLGLVPGHYVAAHLRALYAVKDRPDDIQREWARKAMDCASELRPRKTIFFASDSSTAAVHARQYAAERNATLITRTPNPNPPLHIEKTVDWRTRKISEFYDTFVDIYIMGQADCLTYNKGGYGVLGLYVSRNSTCAVRQDQCSSVWVDDPSNGTKVTRTRLPQNNPTAVFNEPLYLEPMDGLF